MGATRAGCAASLLLILIIGVVYWALSRFSFEGQVSDRFNDVIWGTPIDGWQGDPVDVSDRVCPRIDENLRKEITRRPDWALWVGNCFFGERVFVVTFDGEGQCQATIDVPPPSCSL